MASESARFRAYLDAVKEPFMKAARLEFLRDDGSVAFFVDNNPLNPHSRAFIQGGTVTVNLQNGMRRNAGISLANVDGEFAYKVGNLWFGHQVRLMEGLYLPDGEPFLLPQGVFYAENPEELVNTKKREAQWNLVDKWAYLDGTLFGMLEGIYEVPVGTNIFAAMRSLLLLDRGNGIPIDKVPPVFTDYYNGKQQETEDGGTANLTDCPYTYRAESAGQSYADILLELNKMLAGWIGYDCTGQLKVDAGDDDINDADKAVQVMLTPTEKELMSAKYTLKNREMYNDVIIEGQSLSDVGLVGGRAVNRDPNSDTNINLIGRKVYREVQNGYYSPTMCEALAKFELKRKSVLQKAVDIECGQIFHLQENTLITVRRPDKEGYPVERHLVTGFSRPIASAGKMTIHATSVNDFPNVETEQWPLTEQGE